MSRRVGEYIINQTLGSGTYGTVKHALDNDGNEFAMKIMDAERLRRKEGAFAALKREIGILQYLSHPNILTFREAMQTDNNVYLVTELARGGELYHLIVRNKRLPENLARDFFIQLLEATTYMHSKGVVHLDIKPENILFNHGVLKLCDFGLSTYQVPGDMIQNVCGTPNYVAPEVISEHIQQYDGRLADCWSCAVTLFAMVSGRLPFYDESGIEGVFARVRAGNFRPSKYFSPELTDLMAKMLTVDPTKRLSLDDAWSHPWVQAGLSVHSLLHSSSGALTNSRTSSHSTLADLVSDSSVGHSGCHSGCHNPQQHRPEVSVTAPPADSLIAPASFDPSKNDAHGEGAPSLLLCPPSASPSPGSSPPDSPSHARPCLANALLHMANAAIECNADVGKAGVECRSRVCNPEVCDPDGINPHAASSTTCNTSGASAALLEPPPPAWECKQASHPRHQHRRTSMCSTSTAGGGLEQPQDSTFDIGAGGTPRNLESPVLPRALTVEYSGNNRSDDLTISPAAAKQRKSSHHSNRRSPRRMSLFLASVIGHRKDHHGSASSSSSEKRTPPGAKNRSTPTRPSPPPPPVHLLSPQHLLCPEFDGPTLCSPSRTGLSSHHYSGCSPPPPVSPKHGSHKRRNRSKTRRHNQDRIAIKPLNPSAIAWREWRANCLRAEPSNLTEPEGPITVMSATTNQQACIGGAANGVAQVPLIRARKDRRGRSHENLRRRGSSFSCCGRANSCSHLPSHCRSWDVVWQVASPCSVVAIAPTSTMPSTPSTTATNVSARDILDTSATVTSEVDGEDDSPCARVQHLQACCVMPVCKCLTNGCASGVPKMPPVVCTVACVPPQSSSCVDSCPLELTPPPIRSGELIDLAAYANVPVAPSRFPLLKMEPNVVVSSSRRANSCSNQNLSRPSSLTSNSQHTLNTNAAALLLSAAAVAMQNIKAQHHPWTHSPPESAFGKPSCAACVVSPGGRHHHIDIRERCLCLC